MNQLCPICQAPNSPDSQYCARCGAVLPAVNTPPPTGVVWTAPPATPAPPIQGGSVAPPSWSASPPPSYHVDTQTAYPPPYNPAAPTTARPAHPPGVLQPVPPRRPPWLLLGLIGGGVLGLLLLIGIVAAAFLLNRAPSLPAVSRNPAADNTPAAAGSFDAAARAAVDASNQAQIAALRTLDTTPLDGVVIGPAYQDNVDLITTFKTQGVYAEATLDRITYGASIQQDADHGIIHTTETWTTRYFRQRTQQQVRQEVQDGLTETYYLVRQNGKWLVEQINIHPPNETPSPGEIQ